MLSIAKHYLKEVHVKIWSIKLIDQFKIMIFENHLDTILLIKELHH